MLDIRILYIALARPKMSIQLKLHSYVAQILKEHEIKLVKSLHCDSSMHIILFTSCMFWTHVHVTKHTLFYPIHINTHIDS